jgi:mevalonate kinase
VENIFGPLLSTLHKFYCICYCFDLDQTERVIQAASEIKQTGATGAYTREFEKMEEQLDEVRQLLENTTVSSHDLERLENLVEKFRYEKS